ncbi:MAG: hypothetical protein AB1540_00090 [Bdellovibrionota bacterium]
MTDTMSKIDNIKDKLQNLDSRDVVEELQYNRPLMYAGIGVLLLGAGLGIWALVRQFQNQGYQSGMRTFTGPQSDVYESSDSFQRSGAV